MRVLLVTAALAALAGCTVGPDYGRPPAPTTPSFKEIDGWKPATPGVPQSGAPWWSIYDDPLLSSLESQVIVSNETLKADEAAFRQASAIVDEARAAYYPTVAIGASAARSATSLQGVSLTRGGGSGGRSSTSYQNSFAIGPSASWVPDIWGKIRRTVESDVANAQASAADLAAAQLSAQGTLAADYFQLRITDEQKRILEETAVADQRTLDITRNQFEAGFAAETDVAVAETQLETVQAQLIAQGVQRAHIRARDRRPDRQAARRSLDRARELSEHGAGGAGGRALGAARAAARHRRRRARDGVGERPDRRGDFSLLSRHHVVGGRELRKLRDRRTSCRSPMPAGPSAPRRARPCSTAGLRSAQVKAARAAYDESVATYRGTVLAAFQQVEDNLSSLRILEQQAAAQEIAVRSAQRALQLTLNQYQAGTLAYTAVVVAQTTALGDEQQLVTILQSRLVASANLIEALGGGWDATQIPAL